jgi:hypothetical protein
MSAPGILLRSPDQVMRLDRMGAAHPTRLSFLRALLRQIEREAWTFSIPAWNLDSNGHGHALLAVDTPSRRYTLVCFSTPLADADRTDRVIATAWDTSYVLYDGMPDKREIARLAANAPRQEAGRFGPRDLILSRANRSVRLFDHVVDALAAGHQPDPALIESVGYLMRTTAVYGNGKFGIADRDAFADRPEFSGPFRAEMLSVWLTRAFTVRLAEHIARQRAPSTAVRLAPATRATLGVGNATGLGMAPFLVAHPLLIHRWFHARETALARVRSLDDASAAQTAAFNAALAPMRENVRRWRTDDIVQAPRVARLATDLDALHRDAPAILSSGTRPWDRLYRHAEASFSLEGQEATVALLLEPHGALIDDLVETMAAHEAPARRIDGTATVGDTLDQARADYAWTARFDFQKPAETARFWYVSEEKLEPRLGTRGTDAGHEREQPLAVARDVAGYLAALADADPRETLAAFLLRAPRWRHVARRVAIGIRHPYAEVRDNLIGAGVRPVDLLRAKLAFFGASRFDPRSDLWLRISLFAGFPDPEDLCRATRERRAS